MKIIKSYSEKFVSMNIFSFKGELIYEYLKDCPINQKRGEKKRLHQLYKT